MASHIMSCPTISASHFRGGVCANEFPANVMLSAAPPPTPNAGYTVPLILITANSSPSPSGSPPLVKKSMGRSVKSKAIPITSPSLSCDRHTLFEGTKEGGEKRNTRMVM